MARHVISTRAATAAAVVAAAAWVHAAAPQTPAPAAPALIALDFYAVTADGKPIADLKSEEVTLKVNGRARTLRSLQYVEQASLTDPAAPAGEALPPPFGTNVAAGHGRSFIIVIDDESIRPGKERAMRTAVARMLAALSGRDRVSVFTVPHGGMKVDLTTDHDKVGQTVSMLPGHAPQSETGSEGACRTRLNLESLEGLLSTLGGGEGPATVLFFSTGMLGPRRDNVMSLAPGMCELTTQHFVRVGNAAAVARAHFYVIQPDDLMVKPGEIQTENIAGFGFTGSNNPFEGLENLAGVTGGHRMALASTGDTTLMRVARETSAYYLASFEPEASERDGSIYSADLKVARPNVVVRARPAVKIARPEPPPARPAEAMTPYDMIRSGRTFRDFQLRTVGFASRHDADGLKIVFIAEAVDPSAAFASAAAGLFDPQGRLTAIWNSTDQEVGTSTIMAAVASAPGTYRLRVAAIDKAGRLGTAEYEVAAELATAGPLKLSSVVLGLSRGGGFVPRLLFTTEPVALAYLELYGGTPGARIGATLEIAQTVNGPAVLATPLAIEATEEADRYRATGAVPIGALPPGDYVIRAIIGIADQPAGRVLRTLRKAK